MSRIIEPVYIALSELPKSITAKPVCLVNAHGWHETSWVKGLAFWAEAHDRNAVCGSSANVVPCSLSEMKPCGHYGFDAEEPTVLLYLKRDGRYGLAASLADLEAEPPANPELLRILSEEELLPGFLAPSDELEDAR